MRRVLWIVPLLAMLGLAGFLLYRPAPAPAEPSKDPLPALPAVVARSPDHATPTPALPITQVVLFSSGVGYFQREGDIDGSTRIDLAFPANDINDLLKSMILQDLGGGHVSAVSYDSHDPIAKTLQSFAVNLTANPTFSQILDQARGEKAEATMLPSNITQAGTLSGTIVGVEHQKKPVGKDGIVEVEMLNLWCSDGMHSVPLADVQRLRFANPQLENEFKRALEVLALSHDTQKKAVSLSFTGEGKRPVRVGYVTENPIWKTSYRLVLNKDGQPFLQGWAVVENPSDEDWGNVRMALVSGRPISFRMDLYQPLYVPRPLVEPELFASLRPPTYNGAMGITNGLATSAPAAPPPPGAMPAMDGAARSLALPMGGAGGGMGGMGGPTAGMHMKKLDEKMDLEKGVASAATATEMGDYFEYVLDSPVSLARQKSALLPIVNKEVQGPRVSIYNETVHPKFPLLGLKFKNTSGLHLLQGPMTVFEGSNYAGDARILDLQPNEERLLSYAIDLGTEVEPVAKRAPDRLIAVKLQKGILFSTTKIRESKTYTVKNRSDKDRTLLIEHPFRADFHLVSQDKPAEQARDVYRFELKVPAGKTASEEVVEEQDQVQTVALTNSDDQSIRILLQNSVTSDKVKEALKQAIELKGKLEATQQEVAHLDVQLKAIVEDQSRLRANLKEVPPTAAAYKRYLEKFDTQETEIEKLQAKIKELQEVVNQQRAGYDTFLANLNVE